MMLYHSFNFVKKYIVDFTFGFNFCQNIILMSYCGCLKNCIEIKVLIRTHITILCMVVFFIAPMKSKEAL